MLNLNNLNSPDKDIETGQPPPHPNNGIIQNGASSSTKEDNISWMKRPCLLIAVGIKWLPVAFISSVIGWSYYAFVVVVCIQTISYSLAQQVISRFIS